MAWERNIICRCSELIQLENNDIEWNTFSMPLNTSPQGTGSLGYNGDVV
jgi:hypothetical protein